MSSGCQNDPKAAWTSIIIAPGVLIIYCLYKEITLINYYFNRTSLHECLSSVQSRGLRLIACVIHEARFNE